MDDISTVEALIEALKNADQSEYAAVMKRINLTKSDLERYTSWIEEGYTRNCLIRTPQFELLLLCWDAGAQTPIHGHEGEDCWVYQISGTIEELRFKDEKGDLCETHQSKLSPGRLTYMHDRMGYHSIANPTDKKSMSLHLYASPIDSCQVYNEEDDCFEDKDMTYHTYKGEVVN